MQLVAHQHDLFISFRTPAKLCACWADPLLLSTFVKLDFSSSALPTCYVSSGFNWSTLLCILFMERLEVKLETGET